MMKFVLAALAMIALGSVGARAQCLGDLPMNGGTLCGSLTIPKTTTTSTDPPVLSVVRQTSHSGGSPGYVVFGQKIYLNVGAPVTNFEWAFTSIIDNHAASGENVAGYFQANKFANGPTWAAVMECSDKTVTPSSVNGALPCIEVDVGAAGLDDYPPVGLRGGITIGTNSQGTTTPTEVGWGVRVTDSQYSSYRRAFYVGGKFSEAGFDTSQGTPTSRSGVTAAAFRSGSNQIWDFSGTNAAYWWLNSGTMQYVANGNGVLNILASGEVDSANGYTGNYFNATPSAGTPGFQVKGAAGAVGYDTSTSTLSGPAFRSKAGQSWDFSGTNTATWALNSGVMQYTASGTSVFTIGPNGAVASPTSFASGQFTATPAAGLSGHEVKGTTGAVGFDTSTATLSTAAVRIAAGQAVCMEATCQRTLTYNSASQKLFYNVAGSPVMSVDASGNAKFLGTVTPSTTP